MENAESEEVHKGHPTRERPSIKDGEEDRRVLEGGEFDNGQDDEEEDGYSFGTEGPMGMMQACLDVCGRGV